MMNASMHHLAIRFGRMPQAEKLKLKAESRRVEKEEMSPMLADHKILVRQIHEAYMKNFNMNKAKARLILTGKTSKPVTEKNPRKNKERDSNAVFTLFLHLPTSCPLVVFPAALYHSRHGDVPAGREDSSGPYGKQ